MEITFCNGTVSIEYSHKRIREFKGKSLTSIFPDYTVLDIETTGLDPSFDEIIEVSAIRVRSGMISETFSSLVKPSVPINNFITELTGITNDMLNNAPPISEILPQFICFIGSDVIVGHNVNFDINFLYDQSLGLGLGPFRNNFVDTMRLARKLFPELTDHKLATLVKSFKISQPATHRAVDDAAATNFVYQHIMQHVSEHTIDLPHLFLKNSSPLKAADIHPEANCFAKDSPFLGKICVFTGTLERMVRRDAMQIVVNMGGNCGDSVTAKTNYLILGNNDYCTSIKDGKSSKQKKAEDLILKGKDILIISEDVFYDMISSV